MENTMTDIFNNEIDNVEVITDEEVENTSSNIIPIENIINEEIKPDVINKEEINVDIPKKKDKILIIQVILLIVWIVLTILIYFFGYNIFEPFIKV